MHSSEKRLRSAAGTTPTRLLLQTVQHSFSADNDPVGDLYEVEYVFAPSPNSNDTFELTRRCAALNDANQTNSQGTKVTLAKNITELNFEFYDGRNWRSHWSSLDRLPLSARVRFLLIDSDSELSLEFSQTVVLRAITPSIPYSSDTTNVPLSPENLLEPILLP